MLDDKFNAPDLRNTQTQISIILKLAKQLDHRECHTEILHIHLVELQPKALSAGLGIEEPPSFASVVKKPGSGCCTLPFKATEDEEGTQEAATSLADANEISMEAAVLSELDGIFT